MDEKKVEALGARLRAAVGTAPIRQKPQNSPVFSAKGDRNVFGQTVIILQGHELVAERVEPALGPREVATLKRLVRAVIRLEARPGGIELSSETVCAKLARAMGVERVLDLRASSWCRVEAYMRAWLDRLEQRGAVPPETQERRRRVAQVLGWLRDVPRGRARLVEYLEGAYDVRTLKELTDAELDQVTRVVSCWLPHATNEL